MDFARKRRKTHLELQLYRGGSVALNLVSDEQERKRRGPMRKKKLERGKGDHGRSVNFQ